MLESLVNHTNLVTDVKMKVIANVKCQVRILNMK